MKRAVFFLALLLLLPALAFGQDLPAKYLASINETGAGLSRGLTFYAPFDNPADPLRLIKGTGTLSFTRATTATYVHPTTGLITSAASDQLRIESNGALIEGQRTNLALQSETFTGGWVYTSITMDNNVLVAPDGATTAETFTPTGAAGNRVIAQPAVTKDNTVTNYTGSFYTKTSGIPWLAVQLANAGSTSYSFKYIAVDNGATKTGGQAGFSELSLSSEDAPNGYKRIKITSTTDNSTSIRMSIYTANATGTSVTHTPDNVSYVALWGAQLEAGSFPSSYIPTVAAAVTRNQDRLKIPVSGNVSNTVGTNSMVVDSLAGNTGTALLFVINGTGKIPYKGIGGTVLAAQDGGVGIVGSGIPWPNDGAQRAIGGRWMTGQAQVVMNGGTIVGNTNFDGTFSVDTSTDIEFGAFYDGAYGFWGHLKNVRVWNRYFTDAEFQLVTSAPYATYNINSSTEYYAGMVQGLFYDGTDYYFIHTNKLAKRSSLNGPDTANNNSALDNLVGANHLGSGYVYGDYVYVPSASFTSCASHDNSSIARFNKSTLAFVDNTVTGRAEEVSSIFIKDGIIYVTSFCDSVIRKYDLSTYSYLGAITITPTISNIQGIHGDGNYFYISVSGPNKVYLVGLTGTVLSTLVTDAGAYEFESVQKVGDSLWVWDNLGYLHVYNVS